jgi:hypothetical protein
VKSGDLVQMKYVSFWRKKHGMQRVEYTEQPLLILEVAHNAIKVIFPNGTIKSDLAEYYEVINEVQS